MGITDRSPVKERYAIGVRDKSSSFQFGRPYEVVDEHLPRAPCGSLSSVGLKRPVATAACAASELVILSISLIPLKVSGAVSVAGATCRNPAVHFAIVTRIRESNQSRENEMGAWYRE